MRRRTPFVRDWLLASVVAFALSYASIVIAAIVVPGDSFATAVRAAWIPCSAGSIVASAPAVTGTRRIQAGTPWVVGTIAGVLTAFVFSFWFARFLVGRLGG